MFKIPHGSLWNHILVIDRRCPGTGQCFQTSLWLGLHNIRQNGQKRKGLCAMSWLGRVWTNGQALVKGLASRSVRLLCGVRFLFLEESEASIVRPANQPPDERRDWHGENQSDGRQRLFKTKRLWTAADAVLKKFSSSVRGRSPAPSCSCLEPLAVNAASRTPASSCDWSRLQWRRQTSKSEEMAENWPPFLCLSHNTSEYEVNLSVLYVFMRSTLLLKWSLPKKMAA